MMSLDEIILAAGKAKSTFETAWELYAETLSALALEVCIDIESKGHLDTKIGTYKVTRKVDRCDDSVGYSIDDPSTPWGAVPIPMRPEHALLQQPTVLGLAKAWRDYLLTEAIEVAASLEGGEI